jgi:hypothetical protein
MANARGGHDNITVQIARILESAAPAFTTLNETPAMTPMMGTAEEPKRIAPTVLDQGPGSTLPQGIPAAIVPPAPPVKTQPLSLHEQGEALGRVQRRGRILLAMGLIAVALILAGVIAWWALGRR